MPFYNEVMNDLKKRTWAEISLENIEENYRKIKAYIPKGTKFLGVVKADAYGHGALPVAHLLEKCGADYLAVSCLDEALELRSNGISMPILILGHTPSEFVEILIDNNITQTVSNKSKAEEYDFACRKLAKKLKVHIKVDTGMSRLGFICSGKMAEEGIKNIAYSCKLQNLDVEGIYTHFAVSDEPGEENRKYTLDQFSLFMHVIDDLAKYHGVVFKIRHCANSGAVVNFPEMALDMVRPGYLLYGYGDDNHAVGVKPCMRFVTTVSCIKYYEPGTSISYGCRYVTDKTTRVGVLSCGYADGLPRAASGKCDFAGPQVGSICMDMCMMDITDHPEIVIGSEVELFGEKNSIKKLADAAGTIPYELLCSVTKRVPRIYINVR